MAQKPKVTLRNKPKLNQNPASLDAFVNGAVEKSGSPEVKASESLNVKTSERQKAPKRKQVTIYMDPELVKMLKIRAVETDRQMSEVTEEAVRAYLGL